MLLLKKLDFGEVIFLDVYKEKKNTYSQEEVGKKYATAKSLKSKLSLGV